MAEGAGLLYTIGHSNLEMEQFLERLQRYGVTMVVDVRTRPQSRFFPWFNRRNLGEQLSAAGVGYGFIDYRRPGDGDAIEVLLHDRADAKQRIFDNCLGGYAKEPSVYPTPGATGPKAVKAMDVEDERPLYYDRIMQQEWFQRGIERLQEVMSQQVQVAVLCSCRDWRDCHRENLIAVYLRRGHPELAIRHINHEGAIAESA